ncbi:hypothetical protein M422DRAFT_263971 [Sphaerobolus stellatus SS14]|uniref:Uncharacterized protein n=1 Tax=Sphaerobolus stellatus (strain SS14) TaxID=990650 RepID=A0A0C9UGU7_SPHS4|nr:hypothetical protein M422DRAFT_263971 [Sphaerobolus stellatus SS14]
MSYHQPISDEQLAPFLEAAKLMTILVNEMPPLVVEEVPAPSELWHCETAVAAYLDAKRKAEEAVAKRKAEEAVVKKAVEEEHERAMDVNSEGEDEVDQDKTPKLKLKKKTKSCSIVDSESEEETEEVKAKRRKAKGKGKAADPEYKQNTVPINYAGCPGVPVRKICEGCKVPVNTWYQRPCMGDVQMDANDQIFYVRSKDHCFICLMRSNVCLFTRDDKADFIMPEAADDEELQAKLRKLCDEQDTFRAQKEKEKAERSTILGNKMKAGTKKKVQVNTKALGSTLKGSKQKVVSEEDNIAVETRLKRARMVVNSDGSIERIPSVAESLHGINKALIETVTLLGDNRAVNERQAKYLCGIETCMANLQNTMQMHVGQVHYRLGELERRAGIWPMEDEEFEPAKLEYIEEEVEEVREEAEEVTKRSKRFTKRIKEVTKWRMTRP